ncbi:hypothetical protein [Acetobacter orleanensis]|uniref:Uncharacterized protein n=1 Tax=Acetobacter orleanensis TaxID=104099 RepID=A0A4Y3TPL2_9PROT|nr:hypothetical protein [Acetobacter orleanensis]GAN68167.1 hypothetical protein Abol_015_006 [Acetobacter orleanensis JCM 7639]GBR31542.1 hypothetical protein AA0473_2571 [Acetobacter orleanensis NRIC 0473]GEB82940.1 hypothetical protein AOR01nite_14170 [Acetobacter orleanensis]
MSVVFPDWMPLWAQLLVIAIAIVFGLAFLMMPFAVFGVKGRLVELELHIQEMQAELRALSMRLAAGPGQSERPAHENASLLRPPAPEGVQVEEIRPPEPVQPSPILSAPVLTPLRTPKVSDAYEPRRDAPPAPNLEPEPREVGGHRVMPWHEPQKDASGRKEPLADAMRRYQAPDADQPPYRPDFLRAPTQPAEPRVNRPYDENTGRSEPVLNWPPRKPADF